MFKKGDTLIEVVLAIGIFSMVAISIVAVLSSSSSSAQTNLETTLARQEIDSQAEALRFIHDSAIADKNTSDKRYYNLWKTIVANAVDISEKSDEEKEKILQYHPTSCEEAYKFNGFEGKPFIINPRAMGEYTKNDLNNVFVKNLNTTSTYPRLVFKDGGDNLLENATNDGFKGAEGIYVLAVKDPKTTQVIQGSSANTSGRGSAYYDFYIRTCWYGIDANQASTISTVVRLHDLDVVDATSGNGGIDNSNNNEEFNLGGVVISYYANGDAGVNKFKKANGNVINGNPMKITSCVPEHCEITDAEPVWDQWHIFQGWALSPSTKTATYHKDDVFIPENLFPDKNLHYVNFYAVWREIPLITYDANGGSFWSGETNKGEKQTRRCEWFDKCKFASDLPGEVSRSGYEFLGWADAKNATTSNAAYKPGWSFNPETVSVRTFYAVWRERNEEIKVTLSWNGPDYDAHYVGYDSGNKKFHAYYSIKTINDSITGRQIAYLNTDCRSGSCTEISTVYTLGGKNYTYYVHNFSSNSTISNATVTVKGQYTCPTTCTFKSNNASGSGRYWNVFSLIDGHMVTNQYHSGAATDV